MRRLSLTVDEELNAVLEAFCTEERCSKADVARDALALNFRRAAQAGSPGTGSGRAL
jgi:hypothetical protein